MLSTTKQVADLPTCIYNTHALAGPGMDVWSVGCVIYELFTGRILFPGRTNNEMLKLMMDVKGPFPKRMLKAGAFTDKHFESDPNMSFGLLEEDAVTKRPVSSAVMG